MTNIDQYKTNRFDIQVKYYSEKARKNQHWFYRLAVVNLILTALIPVVSLSSNTYVAALFGAGATIISGLLLLFKNKDLWTKYCMICETLKSYEVQFDHRIGEYAALSDEEAEKLFIERCEQIMTEAHKDRETLFTESK